MSTEPTPGTSLRARKKLATRAALSKAALTLAAERGPERVRVPDIAASAGVSPKTFNNYFPSKEAAIVATSTDWAASVVAALHARPDHEPLWTAIAHAVTEQFADADPPDKAWVASLRLITQTPALQGEYLKAGAANARRLADAVAQRTGTDAEDGLYPRLVAAVVISAEQTAIDRWIATETTTQLAAMVRDALEQVAAGLPAPTTSRHPSPSPRAQDAGPGQPCAFRHD